MSASVIQIAPLHYIHVLDKNSNLTRLIGPGPQTFIRAEHEQIVLEPTKMIILTNLQFCEITNPIQLDPKTNQPILTNFGQIKNLLGEKEIRTHEDYPNPFVLYPGEILSQKPSDQIIVLANEALKLKKLRDSTQRKAGEEYQLLGPLVYIPQVDELIVEKVKSSVIKANEALKLLAKQSLKDANGIPRKAGEKWLVRQEGSYLPSVFEKVIEISAAQILTDIVALHLRAKRNFTDVYGIKRKAGEEWLVTNKLAQSHIVDIDEEKVKLSNAIILSSTQYCVILNPFNPTTKKIEFGKKVLKRGQCTFFLEPYEELENGKINETTILADDEALLLLAEEEFTDETENKRVTGEKWMVYGPREFVTPIEVKILEYRQAIPLNQDEGVYVRNNNTGEVQKFMGQTIMLKEYESLWEKELPEEVEILLKRQHEDIPEEVSKLSSKRDKTKVVQYRVQKRRALQLFNYKTKETRIIFGPALAIIEPDEQFTLLNLSGGAPKKEGQIKALTVKLGPDFMSDILIVETSDHAQLALSLTYNWEFLIDKDNLIEAQKLFSIKDFVGDACKQIASRVRGAISQVPFESFHKNSASIIQQAVFGFDKNNQIRTSLFVKANNLSITSVDIYNVEITDPKTREYLQRSINLAIEISAKSQEDKSKFQAQQLAEYAKGLLQLQSLEYQGEWQRNSYFILYLSEKELIKLYELEAQCTAVNLLGKTLAEAKANSEKLKIEGEGQVTLAELKTKAKQILFQNDLEILKTKQNNEYMYEKECAELQIKKAREMSQIEINKLTEIINAIGKETIVAISRAGPEMKAKLLKGLGLKGYLVTDGKNPINLFNTANGLMGAIESQ